MMGDTRMETYYGFVSTSEDALALFEACRLGYKQRVPRRLSDAERAAIRSGSVFVWEENESGMKRWTDGRSWSPSRVQGCFLTYHEWEGRRRAQRHPSFHAMHGFNLPMNMHGMAIPMGIARYGHFIGGPTKAGSTQVQYGFPKENGMLKKALSIRTTDGKRLHIIAYYSKEDHAQRRLLTPTTDPNFPKLVVPPNLYPDMSPESMYGASHSLGDGECSADPSHGQGATGASAAQSCGGSGKQGVRSSSTGSIADAKDACGHLQSAGHAPAMEASGETLDRAHVQRPSDLAVEALSAGLHKTHVQMLGGSTSPASLHASRPAPEPTYPHSAHPMSAPSLGAHSMRPSSNSFSGFTYAPPHRGSAPGMQSESAPASSVMRTTAAAEPLIAEPHALPPIVSEATLMQAHADMDRRKPGKYLGLGGAPLGLGARRATPLRSVTTAAVMVHSPYVSARTSPDAEKRRQPRMHSTSQLPLLLSPINPPQLPVMRSGSFSAAHISLAGLKDVREGPRRLPSISDSMRRGSSPGSSCFPGGLGIYNAGSTRHSSLLPSPLPTPRQSAPEFDAIDRVSPTYRCPPDSLSLLASAADRAQGRQGMRNVSSGHHPYMRNYSRRGPSARSVSFKQSEDIRQLGVLDQSLKLK
ncbi:Gluconate transport-inducing protein [Coemansia brasiliensis]|uniref:Gluconate transport-inducing protein n=1 Tax=Coemansia brasiliensis TaxID=2650707 RepID=A0A9W8M1N0_9FUNG|nr:Gluconate transport-inducing protein [Coemansia brasiliensis]